MKKVAFVFTLLVAAVCCGVQAQRPVGDTITGRDSTFFYYHIYDWIGDESREWGVESRQALTDASGYRVQTDPTHVLDPLVNPSEHYNNGNAIFGVQLYTERPLKVVGIAAAAFMQEPCDTVYSNASGQYPTIEHFLNTRDTTLAGRATDSMILYKPVDGDLVKLMDGPWRIEDPHRYISLPPRRWAFCRRYTYSHQFIDSTATSYIAPLYEVMFEKPEVVEDSFVVAITTFNNEGHRDWEYDSYETPYYMWLWDHNPTRVFFFFEYRDEPTPELVSWFKLRTLEWKVYRGDDSLGGSLRTLSGKWVFNAPVILPIIEPGFDTTLCHEVSNLRVAERGAGCATLMWDAGDGGPWIVAYGKIDDAWEDFIFDTVSSPMITLTGLEVGTQYFALVRGYCGVTNEYGEWTSPLEVEVYQSAPDPEGIEHPSDLGRFTRLIPSPAHGVVNVVSSFRLSRIELYALDGRKVLEQKADGISTVVDVSGLPSGTYIAALYLPHGVATKKLLVEN